MDSIANKKSSNYKLIKFEDLESASGIDTLFDFIGLKSANAKIEKFQPIGANAWKKRYNFSTTKYLEERLEEPLKYFNYL